MERPKSSLVDQKDDTANPDDTDTDADTDLAVYDHALVGLTLADRGEGFDLDGDGQTDNALWPLASSLDPVLAGLIEGAPRALVLQLAGLDDWADDPEVALGLFSATVQKDGSLQAGAAVDADGVATVSTPIALIDGTYDAAWLEQTLPIGGYELQTATPLYLAGTPTAALHDGMLGFGVSLEALTALATAAGHPEIGEQAARLADLDTDDDGTDDAISTALAFEAEPCTLAP